MITEAELTELVNAEYQNPHDAIGLAIWQQLERIANALEAQTQPIQRICFELESRKH